MASNKHKLIRRCRMIFFAEDRKLVVESYDKFFRKSGEVLAAHSADDLIDWVCSVGESDLICVEAFLIGNCTAPFELVSAIKKRIDAPVIAMLDSKSLDMLVKYYRCGADDVVVKPVQSQELLIRIAAAKKRAIGNSVAVSHKPITVFFDGRDPMLLGEVFNLPRRERRILEYLSGIKGRRATRSQLFGAIYGVFEDCIEENVVESHVSKLRKKLRETLEFDPIDSKRFLGYKLDSKFVSLNPRTCFESI